MTRSKLSSRSLAKAGLNLLPLIFFLSACTSSTAPSFPKENIPQAVKGICKKEYKLDVSSRLVGRTLWVYMPLEDIISEPEKPVKYIERFEVEGEETAFEGRSLKVNYAIKPVEETVKTQTLVLDSSINEKIFNVLQVVRRVLFSIDTSEKYTPLFFCIVVADIKNGFEIKEIFSCMDLKKLSYGFISQTEYQHRVIQDTEVSPEIIGDKEGNHLLYRDITFEEFITDQIRSRIKMKFQKPEVEKNADIDKEVLKIVAHTLDAYRYKDFDNVELDNLESGTKTILNKAAILSHRGEQ